MVSLTKDISSVTARSRDARVVHLLLCAGSQITRPSIATSRIRLWLASRWECHSRRLLTDWVRALPFDTSTSESSYASRSQSIIGASTSSRCLI